MPWPHGRQRWLKEAHAKVSLLKSSGRRMHREIFWPLVMFLHQFYEFAPTSGGNRKNGQKSWFGPTPGLPGKQGKKDIK